MSKTRPLIEVEDLNFRYGNNLVLEHVSFSIERGDYVGIIGPNGSGKTTLLKILVGLLRPESGTVRIDGVPIESYKKMYEIGYVPQKIANEGSGFPVTVSEIVESGRTPIQKWFERFRREDRAAVEKALKTAGISDLKHRLMSSLSGGQRQRVYVARALAAKPKILILDEPFVGVDVAAQRDFFEFLKRLNVKEGMTIIFVSHDIDVLSEEVKSVVCLNRGLLCFGKPALLHDPKLLEKLYGRKVTHIHRHEHLHRHE
jgi:zinc transport system ATP-binding protein